MDTLHLLIAFAPLAAYLMFLGGINLRSRARVVSGGRDIAALGLGLSGFVIAGPMELFFPDAAATRFGPFVWLILIAFYGFCMTFIILSMRQRIVIYNMSPSELMRTLEATLEQLDAQHQWIGNSVYVPGMGMQFIVEATPLMKNAQMVAASMRQPASSWRRLERALAGELRHRRTHPNRVGLIFVATGVAMITLAVLRVVSDPTQVVQSLEQMLRR